VSSESKTTPNSASPTGIVLAGAHSWTNSAFDALTPRSMVPIAHRPLISYALSWLGEVGIKTVAVCGNRESRLRQTRLEDQVPAGMRMVYLEDAMPRGAAGCVRDAVMADSGDTFVVTDGTSVPNVDLKELLEYHRNSRAVVTVVVHPELRDDGTPGLRTPTGVYVFERGALEGVPARGFYDIKEHLIPRLHRAGERVLTYSSLGAAPRVLGASTYLAVSEWVVEQLVSSRDTPVGYRRIGDSLVHCEASVASDAVLVGPVLVGPGARVQSGAVLVGPTSLGRDVRVGSAAVVSRSAIWRRSVIGDKASIDRSVVADDAVIEPEQRAFRAVIPGRAHAPWHP
jgi:NDP-sugar pyrophosphorylase family protein